MAAKLRKVAGSGWQCTATEILQEGKDRTLEDLGGCGVWTVAGRLEARGRNNDPMQKEQCLASDGRREWRGPEDPERKRRPALVMNVRQSRGGRGHESSVWASRELVVSPS